MDQQNNETKKKSEAVSGFFRRAGEVSKKVAGTVSQKAGDLNEKIKHDNKERRLRKFRPIMPEDFLSMNLPNVIQIVDDAVRRGIDVCEGSIGWLTTEKNVEILCLYDEAVQTSGLQFIPQAVCDAVYCVDPFDRKKFIRSDCIFSKTQEERLAELEHIAFSLGAKSYSVEIIESETNSSVTVKQQNTNVQFITKDSNINTSASTNNNQSQLKASQNHVKAGASFEGTLEPRRPSLKWFMHDDNVKNLIEMRCTEGAIIKKRTLELSGATSSTMTQKVAIAIDYLAHNNKTDAKSKSNTNMESQLIRERQSKLLFEIQF